MYGTFKEKERERSSSEIDSSPSADFCGGSPKSVSEDQLLQP